MSAIPKSQDWIDFFELFRELPAIWQVRSKAYKNRRKKQMSFQQLLKLYQKIDATATVDGMRRRINILRTSFNRELRRVEQSELGALHEDDIYVPQLWYFPYLLFLRDEENSAKSAPLEISNTTTLEPWEDSLIKLEVQEEILESSSQKQVDPIATPAKRVCCEDEEMHDKSALPEKYEILKQALDKLNDRPRDEAAIYAEAWATSYRKLDDRQKLLAKKAIEEIFVLGQIQKLQFNSVRFTPE